MDEFRQVRSGCSCLRGFATFGVFGAWWRLSLVSEPGVVWWLGSRFGISRLKREMYRRKVKKMIKDGTYEKAHAPQVQI